MGKAWVEMTRALEAGRPWEKKLPPTARMGRFMARMDALIRAMAYGHPHERQRRRVGTRGRVEDDEPSVRVPTRSRRKRTTSFKTR